MIDHEVTEFINGNSVNLRNIIVDSELEENMRSFRPQAPEEVECRREMLKYKRQIDVVARALRKLVSSTGNGTAAWCPSAPNLAFRFNVILGSGIDENKIGLLIVEIILIYAQPQHS